MEAKRKRFPLLLKSSLGIVLVAAVFTAALVFAIYHYVKNVAIDHYKKQAAELATTIALSVDGDRIGS